MNTKAISNALADTLTAIAGLPDHKLFRHYRPLSLAGASGATVPALSVAPAQIAPQLRATTGDYEFVHRFMVTWYAAQMRAMKTGRADETAAALSLDHLALIVDEISGWEGGDVPGLAVQNEAVIGDIHGGVIEGGILTYEIHVAVTTWEL